MPVHGTHTKAVGTNASERLYPKETASLALAI